LYVAAGRVRLVLPLREDPLVVARMRSPLVRSGAGMLKRRRLPDAERTIPLLHRQRGTAARLFSRAVITRRPPA